MPSGSRLRASRTCTLQCRTSVSASSGSPSAISAAGAICSRSQKKRTSRWCLARLTARSCSSCEDSRSSSSKLVIAAIITEPPDAAGHHPAPVAPQLVILVGSIGLADSLNPGTIGPALFLATTARPRVQVAAFAAGVFGVNLAGGALIALGPGQLLLSVLPRPNPTAKHVIEIAVGA